MRKLALPVLLTGSLLIPLAVTSAVAAPKSKPACGVQVLPLVVGNTWTYESVEAPWKPLPNVARIAPQTPTKIVLTVKTIEPSGKDTVVTLEEVVTYAPRTRAVEQEEQRVREGMKPNKDAIKPSTTTITSTITCNAKKFEISPNSFLFAGEPGAFHGLEFDSFERKRDPGWKLVRGTFGAGEWVEEIVAHWKRHGGVAGTTVDLGTGKLEIERKFTPEKPEPIATKAGNWPRSEKLAISTTGRVYLDHSIAPDAKPCIVRIPDGKDKNGNDKTKDVAQVQCDLPPAWVSRLWLVNGVGLVQSLNPYGQEYQLAESKLQ